MWETVDLSGFQEVFVDKHTQSVVVLFQVVKATDTM
jgi:hypothetical protein